VTDLRGHAVVSLLRDGDIRRVWAVGLFAGVGRWLEMLVAGIYAFDVTGSPMLVALLILLRMAPFALFGPLVGALADRLPPRLLLAVGLSCVSAVSGTVLMFFLLEIDAYWVVALACFVAGLIWCSDMPLRRRLLGDIAGSDRLAAVMGIDSATGNGTRMLGPLIGGGLYAWLGAGGAFGLAAVLFATSALLIAGLRRPADNPVATAAAQGLLRQMREALQLALRDREILAILSVTVIFNIWGFPFVSMIPVIGADELTLTPELIGVLASLEGAGALTGALTIAFLARPLAFRWLYVGGTACYMIMAFVVGSLGSAVPVALAIFCVGLAGACFGTMQSTLIYATAPDGMRGRMFGLIVLAIGTGLIGFANIGLMGELFGASTAVRIVAAEGLIPLVIVAVLWARYRRATG
tara:strand:+ start:1699 stop:2928 length:1230 start_codon:yes stop_codon:yes gene_type:complete